jgi:RimJ/RimL family protein N-acetyltransferase
VSTEPTFSFERFLPRDHTAALAEWLSSEEWPFHVNDRPSATQVASWIAAGDFDSPDRETYWILDSSATRIGLVQLEDLDDVDDGEPQFDLRIRGANRNRGAGKEAVRWLTDTLFERYPELHRISGSTRGDNLAMQKVFEACGYVKEGVSRQAWRTSAGERMDSVRYGMIRPDWNLAAT